MARFWLIVFAILLTLGCSNAAPETRTETTRSALTTFTEDPSIRLTLTTPSGTCDTDSIDGGICSQSFTFGESWTLTAYFPAGGLAAHDTVYFATGGGSRSIFTSCNQVGTSTVCTATIPQAAPQTGFTSPGTFDDIYVANYTTLKSSKRGLLYMIMYAATVKLALTTTSNPVVYGEPDAITVRATMFSVAGHSENGVFQGTFHLFSDGVEMGTEKHVANDSESAWFLTYTPTTAELPVGTHAITATFESTYHGEFNDAKTDGASGSDSPLSLVVSAAATMTTVSSSSNPMLVGGTPTITAKVAAQSPSTAAPTTGTVTFSVDGSAFGTVSLDGTGQASISPSGLALGTHSVSAVFNGTTTHATSAGNLTQTISAGDTATEVAVLALNPGAIYAASTSYFVTVTGAASPNQPTGSVGIYDDDVFLGSAALSTGAPPTALFSYAGALAGGTHTIIAKFVGDSNNAAASGSTPQTIAAAPTTTSLTSSIDSSIYGQSVTFTAHVSGASPAGSVTFKDGASLLSCVPTALTAGSSSCNTSALSVGSHTITATFAPSDTSYAGSVYTTPVAFVVSRAGTTLSLGSSASPAQAGAPVTLTATVSASAPGAGTPTGAVSFFASSLPITCAEVNTLSNGTATCTTTSLTGTSTIEAIYEGDSSFSGSNATTSQVVSNAASVVTLTASPGSTTFTQATTLTATVTGDVAPIVGSFVVFFDTYTPTGSPTQHETSLGSVGVDANGVAALVIPASSASTLRPGSHAIRAYYAGDGRLSFGQSTKTISVSAGAPLMHIATDRASSVWGQAVTFTASVDAFGTAPAPTGKIELLDNGTAFETLTPNAAGVVTATAKTDLAVAMHTITAKYRPDLGATADVNYATASASTTVDVSKASAVATVFSAQNPTLAGQSATFAVVVSAVAPGAGTPTGTVTLTDGATAIGAIDLASGAATLSLATLSVGSHTLTASYAGDAHFQSVSSTSIMQDVTQDGVLMTLSSSGSPSLAGAAVTFTAVLTATSGRAPTGKVAFFDGSTKLGESTLGAGPLPLATFVATLSTGAHAIRAVYQGDADHTGGAAATLPQQVSAVVSSVKLTSTVNPSTIGQAVTLVAAVVANGTVPTGDVVFRADGEQLASVALDSGVATLTTSVLIAGSHTITAQYAGTAGIQGATTSLEQIVQKGATTTALASSSNPSALGASVTLTATVTPVAPATGTASGSVVFKDGDTVLGTSNVGAGGVATLTASNLTEGDHTITTEYAGDASFIASASTALTQKVSALAATITVVSAPNPSSAGAPVTISVTVVGADGAASGTVLFTPGGSATLDASGTASVTTSTLPLGTSTITVTFAGDGHYLGGTGSVAHVVTKAPTTVTLTSSRNPAPAGAVVTFVASVDGSGDVELFDGATSLGKQTVSNGRATFTVSSLGVGHHAMKASYAGASSVVLDQTIEAPGTAPADAGTSTTDAGTVVPPPADASTSTPSPSATSSADGGCSSSGQASGSPLLLLLALVFLRQRRTKR